MKSPILSRLAAILALGLTCWAALPGITEGTTPGHNGWTDAQQGSAVFLQQVLPGWSQPGPHANAGTPDLPNSTLGRPRGADNICSAITSGSIPDGHVCSAFETEPKICSVYCDAGGACSAFSGDHGVLATCSTFGVAHAACSVLNPAADGELGGAVCSALATAPLNLLTCSTLGTPRDTSHLCSAENPGGNSPNFCSALVIADNSKAVCSALFKGSKVACSTFRRGDGDTKRCSAAGKGAACSVAAIHDSPVGFCTTLHGAETWSCSAFAPDIGGECSVIGGQSGTRCGEFRRRN